MHQPPTPHGWHRNLVNPPSGTESIVGIVANQRPSRLVTTVLRPRRQASRSLVRLTGLFGKGAIFIALSYSDRSKRRAETPIITSTLDPRPSSAAARVQRARFHRTYIHDS
ncbi:uncharacterized protein PFL1_05185 [Pseudozyma flocculosa PF-1]|uniref:Uncharacterized protein n=1 Tax=Pseudozyma flocculosa PF-1 TaxID=1277687 RepID=A0A061H396_9BASI|nr:uncharacterized protein PFL1_05185 [Pseudozyma flocculosa PF-1]EPQ27262.1 hypothetical protein PFL1_05185 [Pseudozyma flocculosa PF-1]